VSLDHYNIWIDIDMNKNFETISIHFVRALVSAIENKDFNSEPLLIEAGLHPDIIENSLLRVTPMQMSTLVQQVWKVSDDEFLCMAKSVSRYGVFQLFGKQAVYIDNLLNVYKHLVNFYNLTTDSIDLQFTVVGNEAKLSFNLCEDELDKDHTLKEFLILVWHRFPSWLIAKKIPLKYVTLNFNQPDHFEEHRLMYPCPVKYGEVTNSLVFDSSILDESIVQTESTLKDYLKRAPLDWFIRQDYYPVFTRKLIKYFDTNKMNEISLEKVSYDFHITPRTLNRKLKSEGTNFQKIKDQYRRDKAIHYLCQPSIQISEISRNLGFSEPAAFTRAFKSWTGVSPATYRGNQP
ncbi:MAG: AraC family transcriptional regulator ligand-binding domain-containing protein, partial [Neptuniibacter sp.]